MSGAKITDGKSPVHLLPMGALEQVAWAFEDGRQKYGAWNWRNGLSWSAHMLAPALRHLFAWARGEDYAPDSKVHHLAHAAACVLILLDSQMNKHGDDDRWRNNE